MSMTTPLTTRDIQRTTFVESLYKSLNKQAAEALEDQKKFIILANSYISDGLEESECIELLMIDGLSREAAESYTLMVTSEETPCQKDNLPEYSFQFEDERGKIWSSYDIGKTVKAANESEAMEKAEELLCSESNVELNKILLVSRIS